MFRGVSLLLPLVVMVAMVPVTAILFENIPCPVEDGSDSCVCVGFSVRCDSRGLSAVPAFKTETSDFGYSVLDLSNNNITDIQAGALEHITTTTLDLSHNPLQAVDDDAFRGLENVLDVLELEDCGLSTVPGAVGRLHRLRSLNLRHNPLITFLPAGVMASIGPTLETLDFSNTGIRDWPLALNTVVRLRKLLSSGNHLTSIPDDAFRTFASTLDYLDISYNALRAFPDAVNDLRSITHLDLSFNILAGIPEGKFTYSKHSLRSLYLVHAGVLREIPPGLKDLTALENLYLSYNPISSAQPDVFRGRIANSLKVLHLDKTLLKEPPAALTYLTQLKELNITWNRIQYMENYALDMPSLETLYLDKNPITNVKFAAFSGLPALKKLYLRNTSLAYVPNAALAQGKNLTLVDLSFNHFEALFDYGFPGMSWLRELVLSGNPLVNVSANAFLDLTGVTVLTIENCLLTGIPRTVKQMHSLRTLRVDGNDIECTCGSLGWVEGWREDQGLIANIEGQCANNNTEAIQDFIVGEGRSCS